MMGQLKHEQEQLFYEFRLDEVVPGVNRLPNLTPDRRPILTPLSDGFGR